MANINPIADLDGTVIGEDVFMMPRIMNALQNKIKVIERLFCKNGQLARYPMILCLQLWSFFS
jgi:hypothetical protein